MRCVVCEGTRVVGTLHGYEPCRACMRDLGYDVDSDPEDFYCNDKKGMRVKE